MGWRLVGPRSVIDLPNGKLTVGRTRESDLPVNCGKVSRRHAYLHVSDEHVVVEDLGSRNGTYMNGLPVKRCVAPAGCSLRFGEMVYVLQEPVPESEQVEPERTTLAASRAQAAAAKLTPAQSRVMSLLLRGLSEKEVAAELVVSAHTVHNHVRAIYSALGVVTRAELLALFVGK